MVAKRLEEAIQEHFESPKSCASPERAGLATVKAALRFRKALRKQSSFWSVSGDGSPKGDVAPTPFDGLRGACEEESPTNGGSAKIEMTGGKRRKGMGNEVNRIRNEMKLV